MRRQIRAIAASAMLMLSIVVAAGPSAAQGNAPSAEGSGSCPNEQLRLRQGSGFLPECRAYEMASPVQKDGGSVTNLRPQSSPNGDTVSFASKSSLPGAKSSPLGGIYQAERHSSNWQSAAVDLPQLNARGFIQGVTLGQSPDLRQSLQVSRIALAPGAIEEGSNLYLVDQRTGGIRLIVALPGEGFFQEVATEPSNYLGGSDDWHHIVFISKSVLLPGALEGVPNMYEVNDGTLTLVSDFPAGVAPEGVSYGNEIPIMIGNQHIISADGSRVFFKTISSATGQLGIVYLHEDGVNTAISNTHIEGEPSETKNVTLFGASADGSLVYMGSATPLTNEATSGSESLYQYNVDTDEMTDLTPTPGLPTGARLQTVLGISDDGSYVYFSANAALAEGAVESGPVNIYVWHDGTTRFIGQMSPENEENYGPPENFVSANGEFYLFGTYSPLTPDDIRSSACRQLFTVRPEGNCADVYGYSYATDELICLSCKGLAEGDSDLGGGPLNDRPGTDSTWVLNDGRMFFNTPNALDVGRDVNHTTDVYEWSDGRAHLLSTGTAREPSLFGDATPDGSTAFIRTSQPLVGQDIDDVYDLYAVRVDGGLEAQSPPAPPSPCLGEECRNGPPGPTEATGPALSSLIAGRGNLKADRCLAAKKKSGNERRRAARLRSRAASAKPAKARSLRRQAAKANKASQRLNGKAKKCKGESR